MTNLKFIEGKKYHGKNRSGKIVDICPIYITLTIRKTGPENPERIASRELKQMNNGSAGKMRDFK